MNRQIVLVLLHLLLGYAAAANQQLTFYWGIFVLAIGLADIVMKANSDERAAKWAAYFVGMEVLLRMTGGNVVWEAGKYGTIIFLVVGLIVETGKRSWPKSYVLYFAFLLPSLAVINFPSFELGREEVSFNLSGPLLLAVSAIYFYDRKMTGPKLLSILRSALLPLLVMLVYLLIATPNIEDIEFGTESNYQASGGFGPNQVSTVIGLACLLLMIGLFFRSHLIANLTIDAVVILFFSFRGLATFSRGGMVGALIGVVILIGYTAITTKRPSVYANIFSFLLFAGSASLFVWNYANEQTKGRLEYRYAGKNFMTGGEKEITSGRASIMMQEVNLFLENPLFGIGPGMGTITVQKGAITAHSHSEYTRLLSEHGMFGVVSLLILLITPLVKIFRLPRTLRPLPLAIFAFVLFTLSHSAMRLAVPGFFYGLCLIRPVVAKKITSLRNGKDKSIDDYARVAG